jgi:hypothetical protein
VEDEERLVPESEVSGVSGFFLLSKLEGPNVS